MGGGLLLMHLFPFPGFFSLGRGECQITHLKSSLVSNALLQRRMVRGAPLICIALLFFSKKEPHFLMQLSTAHNIKLAHFYFQNSSLPLKFVLLKAEEGGGGYLIRVHC